MAEHSAPKKSKTQKKTERPLGKLEKQFTNVTPGDSFEEKLLNEPYQCTGRLIDDIQILCKQNHLFNIPPIIHRPKRLPSPVHENKTDRIPKKKNPSNLETLSINQSENFNSLSADKQKSNSTVIEQDENKEPEEPTPKTFILVKDRFEYFKPKIHVEYENPDKNETVSELYIKGWKIELNLMNIFQQALPNAEKLSCINLWYCGLSEETLDSLTEILPNCKNLKNVSIDGNKMVEENFFKLIKSNSLIQHLSLRNCQITDIGAEKLGNELGNIWTGNTNLLSLNLSGNYIGDAGAIGIAKGLRTNRTLLVLNLSGNQIGDLGACHLAETLSRFKMTHEEIVRRRTMRRERILRDLSPHSRNKNMSERSTTMAHKSPKEIMRNKKEISNKSKSKDTISAVPEKTTNSRLKSSHKESVSASGTQKKDKSKEVTINNVQVAEKSITKTSKSRVSKSKNKDFEQESDGLQRTFSKLSNLQMNMTNESDPLLGETEGIEGELLLIGNRTLLSLNLSRNRISLVGLNKFLSCIEFQISLGYKNSSNSGLLKLNLFKNDFPLTDENYLKLMDLMKTRNPIAHKTSESIPDRDSNSVISREGKDTMRTKSSRK